MILRSRTRRVVYHHSAGPRDQSVDSIRAYHKAPEPAGKGYEEIAYHWLILEDGTRVKGRDIHYVGAHDEGENADSIGVCVLGDNTVPGREWTSAQKVTLVQTHRDMESVFGPLEAEGHRDRGGDTTVCPGCDVRELFGLPPVR